MPFFMSLGQLRFFQNLWQEQWLFNILVYFDYLWELLGEENYVTSILEISFSGIWCRYYKIAIFIRWIHDLFSLYLTWPVCEVFFCITCRRAPGWTYHIWNPVEHKLRRSGASYYRTFWPYCSRVKC